MIKFTPHPEIALSKESFDPSIHKTWYYYDYQAIFRAIADGKIDKKGAYRKLILDDLFFIVLFVMEIWREDAPFIANNPFVVDACRKVQAGPCTDTLDIWARFHFKSTIITQAETIQYELRNKEHCTGIFAYSRPAAKKFLRGIKTLLESSELLKWCFPDVLYAKPESESPKWSLAIDTPVLTTKGWKNHGDLRIGDRIYGSKGQVITVIGNSGPMEDTECRKVTFDDCMIVASSEHLWPVQHRKGTTWKNYEICTFQTDAIPFKNKQYRMLSTPAVDIPLHKKPLTVHPYILGLWLGDGTIGTNVISMHNDDEPEILEQFSKLGYEYYVHRKKPEDNFSMYGLRGLKEGIEALGCLREKHIPEHYLFNTTENRLSLLQGLMDSDGTCKKDGPSRCKGMCMFSNTNINLFKGVVFLASSLGLRPSKCSFMPQYMARKQVNHVYFVGLRSVPPFRLSRKLANCKEKKHQDGRYLRAIEPIESVAVNCIKVDAEDSLYLAGPCLVPTHNSEDDGLVLRRNSASRGESSIEAWGLTEGMPTGRHFERCVFDDLETEDIRESPEMLSKVFSKFEMAGNLGTGRDTDVTRIIGTYYSHFGPNVRIRDKKLENGDNIYVLRVIPGSIDGTRDGKPVLMDDKAWEKLKTSEHFNSQQLCDPTPATDAKLDFNCLRPIEPQFIPRTIHKFMVLDQAGGDETKKLSKDLWSYGVIGIEPVLDDIGQSNVYLLDVEADQMSHSEGIDGIVRMYLRNGIIQQMGVEKVGMSTTEMHIANALRIKGRRLSLEAKNLVLLKPAGRSKNMRVENALQWPLNNGKIFYSTAIPQRYIDAIKEEMLKFPFYHVDILDMIAYSYDLFKEFKFPITRNRDIKPEMENTAPLMMGLRGNGLSLGLRG